MASENFIFISYARTDEAFAVKLARDLRDKGVNVWIDQFDIYPGEKWDSKVQQALRSCGSIMVILSPTSVASDNVQNEVAYAIKQKRTVIPVLYEECDIPFGIVRLHYVDFTKDYERGFQELIESVGVPHETAPQSTKEQDEKDEKKETEDRINSLYREADAATANENWSAAKEKLQAILQLQSDHAKAIADLEQTQTQMKLIAEAKELADLYAKGKSHYEAKRWHDAFDNFGQIKKRKDNYKDVDSLVPQTKKELQKEKEREKEKLKTVSATPRAKPGGYWQRGQVLTAAVTVVSAALIIYFVSKGFSPDSSQEISGMAYIPPGTFLMGSADGQDDEKPVHEVTVDAFYMDSTEVMVEQYRKFLSETRRQQPTNWTEQLQQPKHPVVYVSWEDAVAYAKWAGKRLPTEAEWEYAARGGLVRKKYPWGDEIRDENGNYLSKANYGWPSSSNWSDGPGKHLRDVGSFSPNKYGIYDMSGNVQEWCADWYDKNYYQNFKNKTVRNPKGPDTGKYRVLRGGGWTSGRPYYIRCAYRNIFPKLPTYRYYNLGFRCVQDGR